MKFSTEPILKREPKLSEQVADFLASEIKKGSFHSGEKFPSEAELTYRFNVSRTVIREALVSLKARGILESSQGSRTRVAKTRIRKHFKFELLDPKNSMHLSYLYELRAILESDSAALTAVRHSPEDISRLHQCLEVLNECVKNRLDCTNANVEYHQMIVDGSGNPYLMDLMRYISDILWDNIQVNTDQSSNLGLTLESQNEHVEIFRAISENNPAQARNAVLTHLRNAARRRGLSILY
jgi:GntR family transcriptional repressor for pyruvate dehydrogenase complex